MAMPPVYKEAFDFPIENCVSRYFGKKTTNPETMFSSMHPPKHVNT